MARRKKRKPDEAPAPHVAGEARTSLRGLLEGVVVREPDASAPPPAVKKKERPAPPAAAPKGASPARPSETLRGDDRIAWHDAFAGVKPLGAKDRARASIEPVRRPPALSEGDEEARARLAALVAGGVRFDVMREGDEVRGARSGTGESVLRALLRDDARPEASLDLHGMRAAEAEREVVRFVRAEQRRGVRRVLVVHGKGLHSNGGAVLGDVVVRALTEGGAAPVVRAFVTAPHGYGGSGALLIELTR